MRKSTHHMHIPRVYVCACWRLMYWLFGAVFVTIFFFWLLPSLPPVPPVPNNSKIIASWTAELFMGEKLATNGAIYVLWNGINVILILGINIYTMDIHINLYHPCEYTRAHERVCKCVYAWGCVYVYGKSGKRVHFTYTTKQAHAHIISTGEIELFCVHIHTHTLSFSQRFVSFRTKKQWIIIIYTLQA